MTPTETAAILRQFNDWRRDFYDKVEQPDSCEIGEAIDVAVELIERITAMTTRITAMQAPSDLKKYWPIAAQRYAKGWNDCIKAALEESK